LVTTTRSAGLMPSHPQFDASHNTVAHSNRTFILEEIRMQKSDMQTRDVDTKGRKNEIDLILGL
jgi:hypothetical protein